MYRLLHPEHPRINRFLSTNLDLGVLIRSLGSNGPCAREEQRNCFNPFGYHGEELRANVSKTTLMGKVCLGVLPRHPVRRHLGSEPGFLVDRLHTPTTAATA